MKKICAVFITVMLTLGVYAIASADVNVVVNGSKINFTDSDGIPFTENGRTLVPLRAAAEAYGAQVSYDGNAGQAIIEKDGITVNVPLGESYIYRNGAKIENDAPARAINGRTYLPIRVVMEALGANVDWDGNTSSVIVEDEDMMFILSIENAPAKSFRWAGQEWDTWNSALAKQNAGEYEAAIEEFKGVASIFAAYSSKNDIALLFRNLAECYGKLGQYHKASLCYRRAAEYMNTVEGQHEQALRFSIMADEVDGKINVYLKTNDEKFSTTKFFGAPNEPENGVMAGMTYYSQTAALSGYSHVCRLQYLDYGEELSNHKNTYFNPNSFDGVVQISWQPMNGLDMVQEDDYLIRQAKFLEESGARVLLRFAGEMNLPSCQWYTADPQKYIEKFRIIAKVFKEYAPSVGLVWAPNFHPYDNVDAYYPGDEYVDYVGASIYGGYSIDGDPLGEGTDRSRLINLMDHIYNTYGQRKPIVVAEAGWCYITSSGYDQTEFVADQYKDYMTYMPIKYPNLKMATIFDVDGWNGKFSLSGSPTVLESYRVGMGSSDRYLSDADVPADEYYYELFSNATLPAERVELCSFVYSPVRGYQGLIYSLDGTEIASAGLAPYTVSLDLSTYAGRTVELRVRTDDGSIEKIINIRVE